MLCCGYLTQPHTRTHTLGQGTLGHTQIGTERSLCKLRKIPISSSPKLICHCLLLVSQTNIHWNKSVTYACVCVRVCECVCLGVMCVWLRFCGLHFYHSAVGYPSALCCSPLLYSLSVCVCLLINCCRQHKHANNFIKFPATATTHRHTHTHTGGNLVKPIIRLISAYANS